MVKATYGNMYWGIWLQRVRVYDDGETWQQAPGMTASAEYGWLKS